MRYLLLTTTRAAAINGMPAAVFGQVNFAVPVWRGRGPYEPSWALPRLHFRRPSCASAKLDYFSISITSEAEFLNRSNDFSLCGMGMKCSVRPALRRTKAHERIPSRESSFRPALDRFAFQFHRHPQFRLSLPERPVRHDRARGRRPSAAARL